MKETGINQNCYCKSLSCNSSCTISIYSWESEDENLYRQPKHQDFKCDSVSKYCTASVGYSKVPKKRAAFWNLECLYFQPSLLFSLTHRVTIFTITIIQRFRSCLWQAGIFPLARWTRFLTRSLIFCFQNSHYLIQNRGCIGKTTDSLSELSCKQKKLHLKYTHVKCIKKSVT